MSRLTLAGLLCLLACGSDTSDTAPIDLVDPPADPAPPPPPAVPGPVPPPPSAVLGTGPISSLARFEQELASVNDGLWFALSNNETTTLLGWGESYVMTSLVHLFEQTGDVRYLDYLARHADGVLAQRDSVRHVKDYRNLELPCWRSVAYTTKPMCFGVHTGIIAHPIVELAVNVRRSPVLGEHVTYDGKTLPRRLRFTRKPASTQRRSTTTSGGTTEPIAATTSSDRTRRSTRTRGDRAVQPDERPRDVARRARGGDERRRAPDRARRLSNYLVAGLKLDAATDSYSWNYWPVGTTSAEDVSHAALNVFFMWRRRSRRSCFGDVHMDRLARTLTRRVYLDTKNTYDQLGPGAKNGPSMRPQLGRWGLLADCTPTVSAR